MIYTVSDNIERLTVKYTNDLTHSTENCLSYVQYPESYHRVFGMCMHLKLFRFRALFQ